MLGDEIEAVGLNTLHNLAFESVWRDASHLEGWKFSELFRLCLHQDSILHVLLPIQAFNLSEIVLHDDLPMIENRTIANFMRSIAVKHAHTLVTEVHLFVALSEVSPSYFDRHCAILQKEDDRTGERTTRRLFDA